MTEQRTTLHGLLDEGQSPWIDNITRDMLSSGELKGLIEKGIVGLTSNPTIFQKAIGGSSSYDDELRQLVRDNKSVEEIYDDLVLDDIRNAANTLRPVYDRTSGADGFVSIEVPPNLAHDTDKTLAEAKRIFGQLNLPNIMVKIPGTPEGIPAFQSAIAAGINVNVTLVFSLQNYREVAEAYLAGLEARVESGGAIDRIGSVASFFVSRVDSAIDKQLDALIEKSEDQTEKAKLEALRGKAAIANAKLAYAAYQEIFAGPRWQALADRGAKPQRCLWASTSTKNPAYRDVLYVEELIGPHTVDTMPPATIHAFLDHGTVARTLDRNVDESRADLEALAGVGIHMDEVTAQLQKDGVDLFAKSFEDMIKTISSKREEMMAAAH